MYPIAVCGDIRQFFNQVVLDVQDQRYHRFLWRDGNPSKPVQVYQWLRVLFGNKSSPDMATYALRYLANKYELKFPRGAAKLKDNTYVDDVGYSENDTDSAIEVRNETDEVLQEGRFEIKVWNSNSPAVDQNPLESQVEFLGHNWDKINDLIQVKWNACTIPDPAS